MRVEHYRRANSGWDSVILTKPLDTLFFEVIRCSLTLEDVYFGADLSQA